jgi:hypothetical protein
VDRGNLLNSAAIALDVVGGLALGAGAVWAIVDRVRSRSGSAAPVAVSGRAGLAFGW